MGLGDSIGDKLGDDVRLGLNEFADKIIAFLRETLASPNGVRLSFDTTTTPKPEGGYRLAGSVVVEKL